MRHDLHWLDMTDRILLRIAVTVYAIAVFMAWLQTTCLICVLIQRHTAHHLDTVSDPSIETNLLSHQSNSLRTADDVLVYPAEPFATVCRIISETLLLFGAI